MPGDRSAAAAVTRFTDKVAFVTGATSGIGRATALAFAREGASVVVADVAAEGNEETAALIQREAGQALAVTCDVTRGADVVAALEAGIDRFGRLDVASTTPASSSRSSRRTRSPTRNGTGSSRSTCAARSSP